MKKYMLIILILACSGYGVYALETSVISTESALYILVDNILSPFDKVEKKATVLLAEIQKDIENNRSNVITLRDELKKLGDLIERKKSLENELNKIANQVSDAKKKSESAQTELLKIDQELTTKEKELNNVAGKTDLVSKQKTNALTTDILTLNTSKNTQENIIKAYNDLLEKQKASNEKLENLKNDPKFENSQKIADQILAIEKPIDQKIQQMNNYIEELKNLKKTIDDVKESFQAAGTISNFEEALPSGDYWIEKKATPSDDEDEW